VDDSDECHHLVELPELVVERWVVEREEFEMKFLTKYKVIVTTYNFKTFFTLVPGRGAVFLAI
jgi:hypothetical protein